ncbi:MAG TPA: TonB-dependent receptor, partial [Pseudoduganella sp.]
MKPYPLIIMSACLGAPAVAQDRQEPLPTVTVTGELASDAARALAAEQARTPGGVTLVDSDSLYQRNVTNNADMLRFVPGVWTASPSGTDSTFISIRGSNLDAVDYDGSGVKLLQDGLPVTAADGNNHNRFVDPLSARHVVIARGANALAYGASTLGGAIEYITPTARDSAPLELFLNAGSHGQRQARVSAGVVQGSFDGLVSVEAKRRDGYRVHNRQERESVSANAGWQLSDRIDTRLYATYTNNDEELPGVLTRAQWLAGPDGAEGAAVAGHYQWNVEAARVASKTTWRIDGDSSLTFGLSYEQQALYHPIVQSPYFSLLINTKQRNAGASVRYNLRMGQHDLVAGVMQGRTTVKGGNYGNDAGRRTSLATRVDNDANSTELFALDRWQFAPRWTAVYGAQGVLADRDIRNTTVATGSVRHPKAEYRSFNPRVGLIRQLAPGTEVFANVSRLYEAPTTYQMEDQASGNDTTLDAMHGVSVEAGTRGEYAAAAGHWHWDVAVYYARLRNEILSVDDPSAPGTSLSQNVDDTVHAGVEAALGASFSLDRSGTHRIEPQLSLLLNHFRFDDDAVYDNRRLPAAPRHAMRGELLYR